MKSHLSFLLLALPFLSTGCSSTPECVVELTSEPPGAEVWISRRGEKSYRGDMGPVDADVRSEDLAEEFLMVGTTPMRYTTLLEEVESGGSVMGFGASVVRKYKEGLLRLEKDGFVTAERHMRIQDGQLEVHVSLEPDAADAPIAPETTPAP